MARSKNTKLLANFDCPGGGQVWVVGTTLYVGHMRQPTGTSIVDVSDPRNPKLMAHVEVPHGWHSHKVRVANDVMIVNHEKQGPDGDTSFGGGLGIYTMGARRLPSARAALLSASDPGQSADPRDARESHVRLKNIIARLIKGARTDADRRIAYAEAQFDQEIEGDDRAAVIAVQAAVRETVQPAGVTAEFNGEAEWPPPEQGASEILGLLAAILVLLLVFRTFVAMIIPIALEIAAERQGSAAR